MATVTAIDYRRTDLRKEVHYHPYWISSSEVVGVDAEDKAAILFSFPASQGTVLVHDVILQVTTLFAVDAGATVGTLGYGTIATDAVTTGGDVTTVDVDEYILSASVTWTTAGYYGPLTASTSDWLTAKIADYATANFIVGADANVPVVALYLANAGGAITAGKCRVHMLISHLPGGVW